MPKVIDYENKPSIIDLRENRKKIGTAEMLISEGDGASGARLQRITLIGKDMVHVHKLEQAWVCERGRGKIFVDGQVHEFYPGTRVIIPAGIPHAIQVAESFSEVVYLCVSCLPMTRRNIKNRETASGNDW